MFKSLMLLVFQGLIRLLSTCASGSVLGAKTLHLLGISTILKDILSGSSLVSNNSISPALTRPAEQVSITHLCSLTFLIYFDYLISTKEKGKA